MTICLTVQYVDDHFIDIAWRQAAGCGPREAAGSTCQLQERSGVRGSRCAGWWRFRVSPRIAKTASTSSPTVSFTADILTHDIIIHFQVHLHRCWSMPCCQTVYQNVCTYSGHQVCGSAETASLMEATLEAQERSEARQLPCRTWSSFCCPLLARGSWCCLPCPSPGLRCPTVLPDFRYHSVSC